MDSLFLKCGLLVLSVLSSLTTTFAMELPKDEKGKQKVVRKISEVAEDDLCGVCYEDAKTLGKDKLRATNCPCDKFICSNCVDKIRAEANENAALTPEQRSTLTDANYFDPINISKARCPFCRKPLSVRSIELKKDYDYSQQNPITIIDKDGKQIVLSGQESAALLKCVTIKNMIDEVGDYTIDLSWLAELPNFSVIKKLITCCDDIVTASKALHAADDIALLKLANYLDAPANVLHFFANRVWVRIQDVPGDNQNVKVEKKQLRLIAQPHLASPKYLVAYAKYHGIDLRTIITLITLANVNVSYAELASLLKADDGWYMDSELAYQANFRFGSLDGFSELMAALRINPTHSNYSLDLSGHALIKMPAKAILAVYKKGLNGLCLNNNLIQVLDCDMIENFDIDKLIIKDNPVICIDDSFYTMVYKKRIKGINFILTLKTNSLTEKEKKEIRAKFYRAAHTIPERFMSQKNARAILGYGLLAGVSFSVAGAAVLVPEFLSKLMPLSGSSRIKSLKQAMMIMAAALCGTATVPPSFWLILRGLWNILRFATNLSHPEMNSSFYGNQLWDSMMESMADPLPRIYEGHKFQISIE